MIRWGFNPFGENPSRNGKLRKVAHDGFIGFDSTGSEWRALRECRWPVVRLVESARFQIAQKCGSLVGRFKFIMMKYGDVRSGPIWDGAPETVRE